MHRRHFYIMISAVLLQGALWCPSMLWWATFVWLAPIFFVVLKRTRLLTWRDGLWWGLVFFSLHLIPVAGYCMRYAQGWIRFVFPLLLIVYCALHAAAWFLCAELAEHFLGGGVRARVGAWFFGSVVFILFVPAGLLWVTGLWVGYPLCFPLVPLAHYPVFLRLLPHLGRVVMVACQAACSLGVAMVWARYYRAGTLVFIVACAPFIVGCCLPHRPLRMPPILQSLGYVCPPLCDDDTPALEVAQEIYYKMCAVVQDHPEISCIVMPELSYRAPLNKHQHVLALWNNNVLHDRISLLIGARRRADDGLDYNSVYYIKQGEVQWCYDKSRLMPLVEYVPAWMKSIPLVGWLFLKDREFCACPCDGKVFALDHECCAEPYICADIFLGKDRTRAAMSDNTIILAVVNDVALAEFVGRLMMLWNVFKAIEEQRICLCVGYRNALVVEPDGESHLIV